MRSMLKSVNICCIVSTPPSASSATGAAPALGSALAEPSKRFLEETCAWVRVGVRVKAKDWLVGG